MSSRSVVALLLFSACGASQMDFVLDYTDAVCSYALDCDDPALRVFDGVEDTTACEAVLGPAVLGQSQDCALVRRSARQCLDALAVLPCPSDGSAATDNLPPTCEAVWRKCMGGSNLDDANEEDG